MHYLKIALSIAVGVGVGNTIIPDIYYESLIRLCTFAYVHELAIRGWQVCYYVPMG